MLDVILHLNVRNSTDAICEQSYFINTLYAWTPSNNLRTSPEFLLVK